MGDGERRQVTRRQTVGTGVRVSVLIWNRLVDQAEREDRPVGAIIRRLLEREYAEDATRTVKEARVSR